MVKVSCKSKISFCCFSLTEKLFFKEFNWKQALKYINDIRPVVFTHTHTHTHIACLTFVLLIGYEGRDGCCSLGHSPCHLGEAQHSMVDVAGPKFAGSTGVADKVCAWDGTWESKSVSCS